MAQVENTRQNVSPSALPNEQGKFSTVSEPLQQTFSDAENELNIDKMAKMKLSQPPRDIQIFFSEYNNNQIDFPLYSPKWTELISIGFEERDLNHDGAMERIIVEMTNRTGQETTPVIHFFGLEKGKWNDFCYGLELKDSKIIEFVRAKKSGEFDTIRYKNEFFDNKNKPFEFIEDYRIKKARCDLECREIRGGNEKVVSCR